MEQRCETCSLVFDAALGACPTCGSQSPGPELELDWAGRTRAPAQEVASVPPPEPEPEPLPAVSSALDVDTANFVLLVRGVDWVLLGAALVELFLGAMSFLGAALNLLGAATSDVYLLSTNRLIMLLIGTTAAMVWTSSLLRRRHGDGALRTLQLWLLPWFGAGRAEWAHLVEGLEPKVRWATLVPTALTGALSGWLVWTAVVRLFALKVTNWGLAFEGLLGLLAAAAFFFTRRLLRRFHLERGLENYVEDPPAAASSNEGVAALVLAGLVLFTGATAGVESFELKAAILPLPVAVKPPPPVVRPPPPPPTPQVRAQPLPSASFDLATARRGVVFIKRWQLGTTSSVGSGFIVSADGLVFTNRHVAAGKASTTRLWVGVASQADPDQLEYYPAKQVYVSPEDSPLDVAVLKISGPRPFTVLSPATGEVALGDAVSVLGYPYVTQGQVPLSFTKGSVTATRVMWGSVPYLQTDAAINPGNSGGPLLDAQGNVVGIVTLKKADAQQMGYALTLSALSDVRARLTGLSSEVTAEPGPVALATPRVIEPNQQSWKVHMGILAPGPSRLTMHLNGGPFWASTVESLPKNFQLEVPCQVEYLRGNQVLYETQAQVLRSLFVRFGEPNVDKGIVEGSAYFFGFSHRRLYLTRAGVAAGAAPVGSPEGPFTLVISRKGGVITFGADDEVLLRYEDPEPLPSERLSIGGFLSAVSIGPISVTDLDGT